MSGGPEGLVVPSWNEILPIDSNSVRNSKWNEREGMGRRRRLSRDTQYLLDKRGCFLSHPPNHNREQVMRMCQCRVTVQGTYMAPTSIPPPFHSFPFLRFPFPSIATSVYYGPSFCQPQTCPCHPNPYSLNHSEEGGLHWCSLSLARSLSLHYPQIHRLHLLHSFLP